MKKNRWLLNPIVASSAVCTLATTTLAACYVCGEFTCFYPSGGDPCSKEATVKVCEDAPRDALEGESGRTNLTPTQRDALCWEFSSNDSEDWAQRPCSVGPPSTGVWYKLVSCGLASGQCCWTKVNFKVDGTQTNRGFQIQDCSGIGCIGPEEES